MPLIPELIEAWTPERLKELILSMKREQYQHAARYVIDLELKNKDARAAGMSFKEREEKYAKKIRIGHRVLKEYEAEGQAMKAQTFDLFDYLDVCDAAVLEKEGLEKALKYALFPLSPGSLVRS